ncbi:hypothetical protein B0H67DRAFT_569562 [Lasiosphaeris hirsuta]|uniref:Uncharacterized protein n=1 Tax=Lasiosphaeris hirsuta TaxID=260670 RepID=A0AA40AZZ3_9PEZI|nr:hypothetical protein B0H67DRAFT_569562 [Lasiosphaeris hirsuta]
MGSRGLFLLAASCLLQLCLAQHQQFYRWTNPIEKLPLGDRRRQAPLPGYHPEFGSCGSGTTCENACGGNWITCKASTSLSLFCYNKVDLNQTCCGNGSGRACDDGYYCAWKKIGGKVWCCKIGQTPKECGACVGPDCDGHTDNLTTTTVTTTTTQYTPTLTTTTTTTQINGSKTATTTVTTTTTTTVVDTHPGTVTETVTYYSTITRICTVTVTVPDGTVTVPGGTVTVPGGTVTIPGPCPTLCKPTKPDYHHTPTSTPCADPPDWQDTAYRHSSPPGR